MLGFPASEGGEDPEHRISKPANAKYVCCAVKGALVAHSDKVLTETPKQSQRDSGASEAIRVEAPTVDNVPEIAGRRTDKRAIERKLCSDNYMAACNCNVAKHDHSLDGDLPDATALATPMIPNVEDIKPRSGTTKQIG